MQKKIIKVINNYSKALNLLDDYDHKKITKLKETKTLKRITYDDCIDVIQNLEFNNDSKLFALERSKGLESIINTIYSSFNGCDLYSTIEEKTANFYI